MLTPPLCDVGAWLEIGSPREPPYMGVPGSHAASTNDPTSAHRIAGVRMDKATPALPIAGAYSDDDRGHARPRRRRAARGVLRGRLPGRVRSPARADRGVAARPRRRRA